MSILSDTEFGLSVLNQFPPNESIVFSPTSFSVALALIHSGASGMTKEEIKEVLVGGASDEELLTFYKSTVASLQEKSDCLLKLGTLLYINVNETRYSKVSLPEISENFSATIEEFDYFNDFLLSLAFLDEFVEELSGGTIKISMDPKGSSYSDLKNTKKFGIKSVLLSTVYFEGKWKNKFIRNDVSEGNFYVKEGITKKVEFMSQTGVKRLYAEMENCEILTLPYEDEKFKFTIVLPKEKFGLSAFRRGLTAEKIQELLGSVKETSIDLSIPKFNLEMEADATEILKKLGVNKAFAEDAELETLCENIFINKIHHNAVIEINENGSKPGDMEFKDENASNGCQTETEVKFVADHPFLFFISHGNNIIFSGQYVGPKREQWEPELYESVNTKSLISSEISDNHFALSFLKQLKKKKSAVISPTSIAFALALVHCGAKENVNQEIRKALFGDASDEQLVNYYRQMYASLRNKSKAAVRIANRIFIRKDFEVMNSYKTNIAKNFAAEAQNLDFDDAEGAAEKINDFVKKISEGMIPECVFPSSFHSESNIVLVNAIYFEGTWANRFTDYGSTYKFYTGRWKTKKVKYLSHADVFELYGTTKEAEILALPYTDENYTFTIILPKKRFGLAELLDNLSDEKLQEMFKSVKKLQIDLVFPQFIIETIPDATSILKSLGISTMFSKKDANLERIAPNVWVSAVEHKAIIDVNANGTRAAGVTYSPGCGCYGSDPQPIRFNADHPFLFFIRYKDQILFTGQYYG